MQIGVYGGSFDPPHNGHLALCLIARELLQLDRILISVSNNPFKPQSSSPDSHRMRMAELLSDEINLTGFSSEVCSWELEKHQPSYTVDLLLYLHTLYPGERITLLLGEDSYRGLPLWKDPQVLMNLCDIAVFGRASEDEREKARIFPLSEGNVRFIHFNFPVSSSEIRELAASGEPIDGLVPAPIREYVEKHRLYRR
ncbi:MAG: nicotinate (nicotinamide) nucleotide adenylyltransferase [Chlorobiaceae bacterium]|nr:nicotinate (nicotinamide) nucleotide adenylyltransferase [Chlorobiaceae bacterium]NTW10078.1 nicotinate (nicotinamide) nucleotide adenylyltransferase [Chlorobiaceae bacterium]